MEPIVLVIAVVAMVIAWVGAFLSAIPPLGWLAIVGAFAFSAILNRLEKMNETIESLNRTIDKLERHQRELSEDPL